VAFRTAVDARSKTPRRLAHRGVFIFSGCEEDDVAINDNACNIRRAMNWARCALLVALGMVACASHAQPRGWKPEKTIELISPSGPGAAVDLTTRELQRLLQALRIGDITVSNKVGGGGAVAWAYLNGHSGDAHYLALTLGNLLTNSITGSHPLTYTDVSPIALLFTDYILFTVKSDSAIKSGTDLVTRLKKDPASVSIGIPTALGGLSHTATAAVMKSAGVDVRKLKMVVFSGAAAAATALLGGHVDVVASAAPALLPHIHAGTARGIAICAPQRQGGAVANVPTWKEQGMDGLVLNWRGVVGPKGLSAAQIAYWEDVLAQVTGSGEWKQHVERATAEPHFLRSADFRKFLDEQNAVLRSVLGELGMAR